MSKHRKPPVPHWKKGNGFCRWCGEEVKNPKGEPSSGRWHSACVTTYKRAAWLAEQRRACFNRDNGVCACCGLDTVREELICRDTMAIQQSLGLMERTRIFGRGPFYGGAGADLEPLFWLSKQLAQYRKDRDWPNASQSFWNADHVRPLVGGRGQDLSYFAEDNLQTLCWRCHREKTRKETGERAAKRRALVVKLDPQPLLGL